MTYRVLLLLSPSADPSIYQYVLEQHDEIQGVDVVYGDSEEGILEATTAFLNGYSVVAMELLLSHTDVVANLEGYSANVTFRGFGVLADGVKKGLALGYSANYVVLSEWAHQEHVFESYRLGAKAFVSRKHPLSTGELTASIISAARGETTYPAMNPSVTNIAVASIDSQFKDLSSAELQIVDLIVNELTTVQIQEVLGSVSKQSTSARIARICRKLGLQNREAVADYAMKAGMVKHGASSVAIKA